MLRKGIPMLYDTHCHILPGIDDGSADVSMSEKMLDLQKKSGVDRIIATPHFYLSEQSIDSFIDRRTEAFEKILPAVRARKIDLICGAEVLYTESLADEDLSRLCIQGTCYMLTELPYIKLSGRFIKSFRSFVGSVFPDIRIILAHAERYLNYTDADDIYEILESDILVQLNCGSFKPFSPHTGFMYDLLRNDMAHFLGTDCHNSTTRPPNMPAAEKAISRKISPDCFGYLMHNAEKLFNGKEI